MTAQNINHPACAHDSVRRTIKSFGKGRFCNFWECMECGDMFGLEPYDVAVKHYNESR